MNGGIECREGFKGQKIVEYVGVSGLETRIWPLATLGAYDPNRGVFGLIARDAGVTREEAVEMARRVREEGGSL